MTYYACISVDSPLGYIHAGTCYAESWTQLTRKASRIANGYFSTLDKMEVSYFDPRDHHEIIMVYHRFNRKAPDNTIRRGRWE